MVSKLNPSTASLLTGRIYVINRDSNCSYVSTIWIVFIALWDSPELQQEQEVQLGIGSTNDGSTSNQATRKEYTLMPPSSSLFEEGLSSYTLIDRGTIASFV